jgi:predicted permease
MRHIFHDLRFGLRMLVKTPGFTAVAVAVLALGIGANTAMFSVVNTLLLRPLAGRADELVGLYSHDRTKPNSFRALSYPNYADIRDRNDVFDGLMAHTFSMVGVPAGDKMRQTFIEVVSSNYFETLGVSLAAGRSFTHDEERPGARIPVLIVRKDRADLLGKTLKINATDFTVVGVAPQGFTGTMALISPEMWLPLGMFDGVVNDIFKKTDAGLADRAAPSLVLAGRLRPGMTLEAAGARLDVLSRQLERAYPAENKDQLLTVSPLPRLGTSTSPSSDRQPAIAAGFLMALSGVVLLIACLNIANMLLARGAARRREIAIRIAVGGGRGRIVMQLLTEGLLLALAGAAGGLLLASWATGALAASFAAVMPLGIEFRPEPDLRVLAATTAFAVLATVMSGLGPALKISKTNLVDDLKALAADAPASLGRRFSARNVLVVGQIALSLMLLSAGGLFARGALNAAVANPGFSYDRQLLVGIDPSMAQYDEVRGHESRRAALERIRRIPGVVAAGTASSVPFGELHEQRMLERVGGPSHSGEAPRVSATYRILGADYFRTLRLPMVRGREFSAIEEDSATAPRVAIVDERLARRLFGADDPLGQMIGMVDRPEAMDASPERQPMQIVGVAAPIRDQLFERVAGPAIYVPSGRNYRANLNIHVQAAQAGSEGDVLAAVRRELREMDPRLPIVAATTMRAFHDRSLELWVVRAGGRMFLVFGVLALLLAVVGLYGVKSYVVSQRTREIGIRMALGARPGDVLGMVLKEGAVLSAVGVVLGLPLAALLGAAVSSLLYDVKPLDPLVFVTAPALLLLSALVATWLPARRATRVTPLTALRSE